MIIDSHVHISYLKDKKEFFDIKKDLFLNMKKNGIECSIVIPDNVHGTSCADLENVLRLVKNEKKLYAIGTLKIEEINAGNITKIEKLFQQKLIKGFKIFPGHDPIYPTDKRLYPIYDLCVKYNYPLIIHTGINSSNDISCAKYNDPKYIVQIAKKYRELKIIIAHYFWPEFDYCFNLTNGFKNIYFDTSALADPEVTEMSGGIEKIKQVLYKTIKRSTDSVIFGTDWPMCDPKRHIDLINSLKINREEKEKIFCGNSLRVFKLNYFKI
jgi:predicted TIM-barrel fold metal-dependent hydrolase